MKKITLFWGSFPSKNFLESDKRRETNYDKSNEASTFCFRNSERLDIQAQMKDDDKWKTVSKY